MKVLLGLVLFFVIISSVGFAHSQSDTIPEWIKGVVVFWAEGNISDLEFIEALEFLIESNIIQVNDPKVERLEKENRELRQKIESFESENTLQPETTDKIQIPDEDITKQHITTDKLEYSFGDVIEINGMLTIDEPLISLNGTITNITQSITFQIQRDDNFNLWEIVCNKYTHPEECNTINDDGTFKLKYEVGGDAIAGTYKARIFNHSLETNKWIDTYSQPITIK